MIYVVVYCIIGLLVALQVGRNGGYQNVDFWWVVFSMALVVFAWPIGVSLALKWRSERAFYKAAQEECIRIRNLESATLSVSRSSYEPGAKEPSVADVSAGPEAEDPCLVGTASGSPS